MTQTTNARPPTRTFSKDLLKRRIRLYLEARAYGRANAKTLVDLRNWLNAAHSYGFKDSRAIRDAIEELRYEGVVIPAISGVGHWLMDPDEVDAVGSVTAYFNEMRARAVKLFRTARIQKQAAISQAGHKQRLL